MAAMTIEAIPTTTIEALAAAVLAAAAPAAATVAPALAGVAPLTGATTLGATLAAAKSTGAY